MVVFFGSEEMPVETPQKSGLERVKGPYPRGLNV